MREGWRTYNFEVEGLHTYVAGGVRVHNSSSSTPTLVMEADLFETLYGTPFTGSQADINQLLSGIAGGQIPAEIGWADVQGEVMFWAPFADNSNNNTIILSVDQNGVNTAVVGNSTLSLIVNYSINGFVTNTQFVPTGGSVQTKNDATNQNTWEETVTVDLGGGASFGYTQHDSGAVTVQMTGQTLSV
jgi:hypothetical protein